MDAGTSLPSRESEDVQSVRLLLRSLAATTALVVLLSVVFVPSFMTNDDPVMLLIASGRLTNSAPDEHLLYINVMAGGGLRWLYERVPSVPWYSLYLYLHLCMAAALTLASCLRWRPSGAVRYLTWILVLSILTRFTMALQFTVVATWLSWASVAWISSVTRGAATRQETRLVAVLGAVGIGLAGLIRPEAAILGALMAAPLLLWVLVSAGRGRAKLVAVAVAAGVVIVLGFTAANRAYYAASPGWEQFYNINSAKTYFTVSDLIESSQATTRALRDVGWSANDLNMLRNWFFVDQDIFSLDKMNAVIASASTRGFLKRLALAVDRLGTVRRDALAEIAVALLVVLVLAAPTKVSAWMGGVGIWYIVVALSVAVVLRPMPPRVYAPCLAAIVCSGLLLASASELASFSRRTLLVVALLLLGPALVGIRSVVGNSSQHAAEIAAFRDDWRAFSDRPSRLVVAWGGAFPYELVVSPLRENAVDVGTRALAGLGTLTPTPFTRTRLRDAGIDDLHVALIDDPGVALIANEGVLEILTTFLRDRYQREVVAQTEFAGETFTAWRLVERSE